MRVTKLFLPCFILFLSVARSDAQQLSIIRELNFGDSLRIVDFDFSHQSLWLSSNLGVLMLSTDSIMNDFTFLGVLEYEGMKGTTKPIRIADDNVVVFANKIGEIRKWTDGKISIISEPPDDLKYKHVTDIAIWKTQIFIAYSTGWITKVATEGPTSIPLNHGKGNYIKSIFSIGNYLFVNSGSRVVAYESFNESKRIEYRNLQNIVDMTYANGRIYALGSNGKDKVVFSRPFDKKTNWHEDILSDFRFNQETISSILVNNQHFIIGLQSKLIVWNRKMREAVSTFDLKYDEKIKGLTSVNDSTFWATTTQRLVQLGISEEKIPGRPYQLNNYGNEPVFGNQVAALASDISRTIRVNQQVYIYIFPSNKEYASNDRKQKRKLLKARINWFQAIFKGYKIKSDQIVFINKEESNYKGDSPYALIVVK